MDTSERSEQVARTSTGSALASLPEDELSEDEQTTSAPSPPTASGAVAAPSIQSSEGSAGGGRRPINVVVADGVRRVLSACSKRPRQENLNASSPLVDPPAGATASASAPSASSPAAASETQASAGDPPAGNRGTQPADESYRLAEEDMETLRKNGRVHLKVGAGVCTSSIAGLSTSAAAPSGKAATARAPGRFVSVVQVGKQFRAIDSICYHAGGPLGIGDIEDVGEEKHTCIRCPWHNYMIDLQTGVKWHQGLEKDATGKLVPAGWKHSPKPVQRVHAVEERGDGLYLILDLEGSNESDWWAQRDDCLKALAGSTKPRGFRTL